MKCNKCNNILPDDSIFCQFCGAKIQTGFTVSARTTEENENAQIVDAKTSSYDTSVEEKAINHLECQDCSVVTKNSSIAQTEKNRTNYKKGNKTPGKVKKIVIFSILCVFLLAASVIAIIQYAVPAIMYKKATEHFEKGEYLQAIETFSFLAEYREYKDSQEKNIASYYAFACQALEKQDYETAYRYISTVHYFKTGGFEDSGEKRLISGLEYARHLLNEQNYKRCIDVLEQIGDYQDSAALLKLAKYNFAKHNVNTEPETVYKYLSELSNINYKDSAEIYKNLYDWKLSNLVVKRKMDNYDNKDQTLYRGEPVYFQADLSGGKPGENLEIKYSIEHSGGASMSTRTTVTAATNGKIVWGWSGNVLSKADSSGLRRFVNPVGTYTIKVYDADTQKLLAQRTFEMIK